MRILMEKRKTLKFEKMSQKSNEDELGFEILFYNFFPFFFGPEQNGQSSVQSCGNETPCIQHESKILIPNNRFCTKNGQPVDYIYTRKSRHSKSQYC